MTKYILIFLLLLASISSNANTCRSVLNFRIPLESQSIDFIRIDALYNLGKLREAIVEADTYLAINDFSEEIFELKIKIYQQINNSEMKQRLLSDIQSVLLLRPSYQFAIKLLPEALFQAKQYQKAIDQSRINLQTDPLNSKYFKVIIKSLSALRDFDTALSVALMLFEFDKSSSAYLFVSSAYKNLNRYSDAIDTLEQARTIYPREPIVLARLAEVYTLIGNTGDALTILNESLNIDPNHDFSYKLKVKVLMDTDRMNEALDFTNSTIASRPFFKIAKTIKVDILITMGRLDEGLDYVNERLQTDRFNRYALFQKFKILILQGKEAQALVVINFLNERHPDFGIYQYKKSLLLISMNRINDAKRLIKRIRNKDFRINAEASLMIKIGEPAKAIELLNSASENYFVLIRKAHAYYEMLRFDLSYRTLIRLSQTSSKTDLDILAALVKIESETFEQGERKPITAMIESSFDEATKNRIFNASDNLSWNYQTEVDQSFDGSGTFLNKVYSGYYTLPRRLNSRAAER